MKYKFTLYATMGDTQIIIESERYKICIEAVNKLAELCGVLTEESSFSIVSTDENNNEYTIVDYAG